MAEDRGAARRSPAGAGLEARARGTLIHRLMESFDFARPQPPSSTDVASVARELGLRVGQGEREEIASLIARASAAVPAARLASACTVRREHPFAFSLGAREPLITGVIDLLAGEADGVFLIVDYKSDRVGPEVELGELVEREYGIQRLLYALAVLREGAARSRSSTGSWSVPRSGSALASRPPSGRRSSRSWRRGSRGRGSGRSPSAPTRTGACA